MMVIIANEHTKEYREYNFVKTAFFEYLKRNGKGGSYWLLLDLKKESMYYNYNKDHKIAINIDIEHDKVLYREV